MKIMLIEDGENKRQEIITFLNSRGVSNGEIVLVRNMTDFAAFLRADIGLFIIDIRIPNVESGIPSQNGMAILEAIEKAGKRDALLMAISSYPEDFPSLRAPFEKCGCILADFRVAESWKGTLDHLLIQLKKNVRFDFLIFCALHEERAPYVAFFRDGRQVFRNNIDCFDISVGEKRGSVILLPKMGLVNAAVTAGICIDRYQPSLVAMSGICGGFKARANLGQLFVSEMAYEYQSGKWSLDGFLQEPYQVPTSQKMLNALNSLVRDEGILEKIESGFRGTRPPEQHPPILGIFTSGSAVIADQKFMDQVALIHRKVHALDMEVFAIQRAAQLSVLEPLCLCAKTVVDLCGAEKNDDIHKYGSYISAKFIVRFIDSMSLETVGTI